MDGIASLSSPQLVVGTASQPSSVSKPEAVQRLSSSAHHAGSYSDSLVEVPEDHARASSVSPVEESSQVRFSGYDSRFQLLRL